MRFPSLQTVGQSARAVTVRFPLVVTAAAVATVGSTLAFDDPSETSFGLRLLLVGGLGLPILAALALLKERRPSIWTNVGWPALAVVALVAFGLLMFRWPQPVFLRRLVQYSLAAHLLAAFLPFVGGSQLRGFWQYNRILFLRFLTAQLFAQVLYAGFAVALLALDKLFGLNFDEIRYPQLWAIVSIMFGTMYFLGGIPENLDALESDTTYPTGIRIFAQYILLPIVAVYVVILTLYLGKVLVTREWPSGWIGYLVSSVSVLGVLSLLFLHPVRQRQESRWVDTYGRLFYIVMLPALGMLLAALGKRVDQYGITENRYFLFVLAVWLAGLCVFYLITRSANIRWFPLTLCVVAALTTFGPWGAYAVSRRSQESRLDELLAKAGMLVDEKAVPVATTLEFEDRRELTAVMNYLLSGHGPEFVRERFAEQWATVDEPEPHDGRVSYRSGTAREHTSRLLHEVGVEAVDKWQRTEDGSGLTLSFGSQTLREGQSVAGFDTHFRIGAELSRAPTSLEGLHVAVDRPNPFIRVMHGDSLVVRISVAEVLAQARERQSSHPTQMNSAPLVHNGTDNGIVWKLVTRSLHANRADNSDNLDWIEGDLYLKWP